MKFAQAMRVLLAKMDDEGQVAEEGVAVGAGWRGRGLSRTALRRTWAGDAAALAAQVANLAGLVACVASQGLESRRGG